MIFPADSPAPPPHPDMPTDVVGLYQEARDVMAVSRRAGAALARATLESLLKVLRPAEPRGTRLERRIENVAKEVSSPLARLLTVVRHAGNKALHVEDNPDDLTVLVLDPLDDQVAEVIFTAINDLVDELVTRPALADSLFERLPDAVRARLEARGTTSED